MGGEQGVGDLREHGICEVLYHECHAVCARPTEGEQGTGLGFAGFECDAGPAELPPQAYDAPVVRAFVHEEGFARGDAVDVEGIFREFIGKGLFDIEDHLIDARVVGEEAVQDVVDVIDLLDGAVEVCTQPHGVVFDADLSDADDAVVIPSGFLSGEFDFEAGDAVALYPVGEDYGIAVVGFIACAFGVVEEVVAAYGVPCGQAVWSRADEIVFGISTGEVVVDVVGGVEVVREVGVHEFCVVRVVGVDVVAHAISVVQGEVISRGADERG